ncbi:hypothetical protein DAPPUDRAFT_263797 [Daphnia pulex]|uniref:Uncharacterized protein n=1 Tax=Daphnia pulex TaxID=6669 RepID=E9HQF1_DAPPU|nr:hypothetical protein DAPPUDRAFT_263797 [Daphnia pulex]|eukprot:EFX66025.1 hypothetical protein DAPPUDRAFT_263797 [Daphnia pulex]
MERERHTSQNADSHHPAGSINPPPPTECFRLVGQYLLVWLTGGWPQLWLFSSGKRA